MQGRQKTAFTFVNIQCSVFLVQVAQYVLVMSNPVILYVGGKFCYTTLHWLFNCTAVKHGCVLFSQDRQALVTTCGSPQVTFGPVCSQDEANGLVGEHKEHGGQSSVLLLAFSYLLIDISRPKTCWIPDYTVCVSYVKDSVVGVTRMCPNTFCIISEKYLISYKSSYKKLFSYLS